MSGRWWVWGGALACLLGCQGSSNSDDPASCDDCACEEYCIALCQVVDEDCGGTRVRDCTEGCFAFEPTVCPMDSLLARSCELLDDEASCYEAFGSPNGDCARSSHTPPGLCTADNEFGSDCGPSMVCEADTNLCRFGCNDDDGCTIGQYCDTEMRNCETGCREDFDCQGDDVCNLETHACEAPTCAEPTDCPYMLTCNMATLRCETCTEANCEGGCNNFGRCVECVENTDCAPTHECRYDVCRQRCNATVPCEAGRVCSPLGLCSDPIGSPCEVDDVSACFGGNCLDEDASLMTVEPYCAVECSFTLDMTTPLLSCPDGYQCVGLDCVRQ